MLDRKTEEKQLRVGGEERENKGGKQTNRRLKQQGQQKFGGKIREN